ncbi:LysR family transcriptional regulator [Vibrio europaeus]|uniref:LysR family transcriptional regulator n=1 Tax=Vibrio europaeus TaxID=300876 RepID=A0A178JDT5_9VIBR|nr:LysR family transcriptional regulator [Vibrio europaeus]MDC5703319.1 LysR family transcriptional regulator [Vibrio europaeus]MDC5711526.1 LysR family transcriptional regulator [Vibrio europaeus]MDC5715019.1 LysR family transcriptional regulator [Vibrio europaeus]MDC5722043.1 LysR family transcriptional regulator [Vibrio europaeus]MDC5727637.1 LysR family transcriptional regulator [Vibrio europaeus]
MKEFNWKGVDLNLLVAFQALFQTNSVSAAAEQCFVSQSAMSHTLQRMRVLFDDPLFERVGTRMEPTQHAQEIAPTIDRLLGSIKNDLLVKKHFTANGYSGVWKIGLTDYAEQLFAPALYDAIKQQSPNSQVSFFNVNRSNYVEIAESEGLDVVIGSIENLNRRFLSEHLYTEQHLCLFDPSSVTTSEPMSLEDFVGYEHALVSPDGSLQTQVDKRLAKLGYERRVGVASRNFLTIRRLLLGRELLCIVPKRFAEMEMYSHDLRAISSPIEIPDFDIRLLFLKANQYEEKSIWIRRVVASVVS